MRAPVLAMGVALAACSQPTPTAANDGAGAALERAAVARGLVADPARVNPVGLYTSASDALCVVPAANGYRVGAAVDYGEGQACAATGMASGRAVLDIRFGDGCRVAVRIERERVTFPATIPAGCDRFCTGRASLAALAADRISASAAEAESAVTGGGTALCGAPSS